MKEVFIVEENREGTVYKMDIFKTKEEAWEFVEKRCSEVMRNREDCLTTRKTNDFLSVVWLDDEGEIDRDEYGCDIELTRFDVYRKDVH